MKNQTSTTELQRMTPDELRLEIAVRRIEYAKMRIGVEMQKEKNHAHFKTRRKEIARMMTVLNMMKKVAPVAKVPVIVAEKTEKTEKKSSQTKKKSVQRPGTKSKKS